jgi:hypothetical protein
MERKFHITGYRPAKKMNDLITAFDLGIGGVFVQFSENMILTLNDDVPTEKLTRLPDTIKSVYEQSGCVNINVVAI